jgi:hypothetical protein
MPISKRLFILSAALTPLALAQPEPAPARPNRSLPASQPAQHAPDAPVSGEAPDGVGEIQTADDLLIALETADADLASLSAGLRWFQTFALAGDMQVRTGQLSYLVQPRGDGDRPPRRAFAITFDEKAVGGRVPAPERIDYVFDGEWFLERLHEDRQTFKRQVVPPGQVADPLRIGEGPFPIPVGQKRDEILSRFTAELVDPVEDLDPRLHEFVQEGAGTYSLMLTPHDELVEDQTWRHVRIWYDRDTLQPRLAWTINAADDESYVQLINVERNGEIDDAVFSTDVPTEEGWISHITAWES